jgi:hypothetical protein
MLPPPDSSKNDQDEDEEQVEDVEAEQPPSLLKQLEPMIAAVVTQVVTSLVSGASSPGSGGLKEILKHAIDWQKAAESGRTEGEVIDVPSAATGPTELPPISPTEMAHFIAIQSALDAQEATLAREVAAHLSPHELRGWFAELKQLAVPDAVARIRSLVAKKPAA